MGVQDIAVSDGRRRSGWFWVDNEIFDMRLKPSTFMVYCFLVRIADRGSEAACISVRKMARVLGMSPITVRKALKDLENLNMLRKIPRKTEKGNNLANLYQLTSKEDWKYTGQRVGQKLTQGGSKIDSGVGQKLTQGGSKIDSPPIQEQAKTLETQRDDSQVSNPINTYKNQKYIKINNHHHQYKGNGKVDDGGDAEKEELSVSRKDNVPTNTNGNNSSGSSETNSRSLKPSASLRENSAAGERVEVEPQRIYKELRAKWDKYLKDIELDRLTLAQAIFFLENSALPPEQTLSAILRDDRNPNIKNPVGTLYKTLPLREEKYRWLLKLRTVEDEEWFKLYKAKAEDIMRVCSRLGVKWNPPEVLSIEEARRELKRVKKTILEVIKSKLSEGEIRSVSELAENISRGDEDMREQMWESLIFDRCGVAVALFYI